MAAAIAWQSAMVETIKDGGVWLVPRSGTIITLNKKSKIATFVTGFDVEPVIIKVFKAMGWLSLDANAKSTN